jgi:predicted transcriptional regulator
MLITADQIRAARGLLDWTQRDLAERTKLSTRTIKRMEGEPGPAASTEANVLAVQRVLEAAGIVFVDPGKSEKGGFGVRFKK